MNDLLVWMEGIDKLFPGVKALDNCRFELKRGEVHALVGENGAGKSTLMKVLTGIYQKDKGKILYKGKELNIGSPREAQQLGIGMVHQELNLMPHLTVAENIYIGREHMKGLLLDRKKTSAETARLLDTLNIHLDPETKVYHLSVAKQQMKSKPCSVLYVSLKSRGWALSTYLTVWMSLKGYQTGLPSCVTASISIP